MVRKREGRPSKHASEERIGDWVALYGRRLRGYLWAATGSPDDADELIQEVFHRAWKSRHRYREEGKPLAYLMRIADRLVVDRARRKSVMTVPEETWEAVEPSDNGEPPWERLQRQEATRTLEEAMNQLSPIQRRVLLLKYYGDLTFAEIADVVGCPLNTALSHARRGLARLRQVLATTGERP